MAQAGEIDMPRYDFAALSDGQWACSCVTRRVAMCAPLVDGVGTGKSKVVAKEEAAYQVYFKLSLKTSVQQLRDAVMQKQKQQMNMSPADQVPVVKTSGIDMSLTAGSHIFSNTQFAQGVTDLNPTAFTLNNIAQTGAPFDIKDSCYHIYQQEKTTTITGAMSLGSEVFRLSLDPEQRPAIHRQYIKMHEAHNPAVEFGVFVNGTAGALGTLKIGYVRDISKASYTLAEIQQIACQDVALSQSSTVSFVLRDIRQKGLYRKVEKDDEPYPGIVALVSSPISNVQRNDLVSYPIQVYSRLSPEYQLAVPTAISTSPDIPSRILLSNYLVASTFDIAINENAITSAPDATASYPDCGWNTGSFIPVFTDDNICAISCCHMVNSYSVAYWSDDPQPTFNPVNDLFLAKGFKEGAASAFPPALICYAFGEVPTSVVKQIVVDPNFALNTICPGATIYTIPEFMITSSTMKLKCSQIAVYEKGVILAFKTPFIHCSQVDTINVYTCNRDDFIQDGLPYYSVIGADYLDDKPRPMMLWYATDVKFFFNVCTYGWPRGGIVIAGPVEDSTQTIHNRPAEFINKQSPLYTYTFLATGNNTPTYAAPSGFSRLDILRPGTSLNSGMPVNPIQAPGVARLVNTLDSYLNTAGGDWIVGTFYFDSLLSEFQFVYRNGIFLVRSSSQNLIRLSLQASSCSLGDLTVVTSPSAVPSFVPGNSWKSWTSSNLRSVARLYMQGQQQQSMAGLAAVSGLGSGLSAFGDIMAQQYAMDNNNKNLALNRQLQMRLLLQQGKNQQELEQRRFQNQLQLKGLSSESAQAGNMQTSLNLPNPEEGVTQSDKRLQQDALDNTHFGPNDPAIRSAANQAPRSGSHRLLEASNLNPEAQEFVPASDRMQSPSVDASSSLVPRINQETDSSRQHLEEPMSSSESIVETINPNISSPIRYPINPKPIFNQTINNQSSVRTLGPDTAVSYHVGNDNVTFAPGVPSSSSSSA